MKSFFWCKVIWWFQLFYTVKNKEVMLDKTIYLSFTRLESEFFMYEFHFDILQPFSFFLQMRRKLQLQYLGCNFFVSGKKFCHLVSELLKLQEEKILTSIKIIKSSFFVKRLKADLFKIKSEPSDTGRTRQFFWLELRSVCFYQT